MRATAAVPVGPEVRLPVQFAPGSPADNTWYAECASFGSTLSIRWGAVRLHDGSSFAAREHARLLRDAKHYFLLYAEGKAGRRPRASTLRREFQCLSALVKWLSRRKVRTFRDLTIQHIVGYRQFLRARRVMVSNGTAAGNAKRLAPSTQTQHLATIVHLLKLQHLMPITGTKFKSNELQQVADMLAGRPYKAEEPTARIPDAVFQALMLEAIRWLECEFPKVLRLHEIYSRHLGSGTNAELRWRRANALAEIAPDEIITVGHEVLALRSIGHKRLRRLLSISRGACFVVIAGFTGMRASEIYSLRPGCLSSESIGRSQNILRLSGTLFKTSGRDLGEPAKWIAGWDEEANPIHLAIEVLEKMPKVLGAAGLFAPAYRTFTNARRQNLDRVSRTQGDHLLKLFAKHVNTDWNLAAHQFRKTFARFVALSGSANILALTRHYKHLSTLMTEAYLPNDPELVSELIEASEELMAERLDSIFGAERLGGLGGQRIVEANASYRGSKGREARRRLVDITMRDPNSDIRLTVYGVCIYDHSRSKCDGKIEKVGLDVCVGCGNFSTSSENVPFWTEHAEMLRANIAEQARFGIVNVFLARQLKDAEEQLTLLGARDGRAARANK
jgi:hypothetical protein